MSQSEKNKRRERRTKLIALAVALALMLLFGCLLWRAWLEGVNGCASVIKSSEYDDSNERARQPDFSQPTKAPAFTDDDYDAVFPDLNEG